MNRQVNFLNAVLMILILGIILISYTVVQNQKIDNINKEAILNASKYELINNKNLDSDQESILSNNKILQDFEDSILSSNNSDENIEYEKIGNEYVSKKSKMTISKPKLSRGDIDSDGDDDAIGIYNNCSASCGTSMIIVLNNNGQPERVKYSFEEDRPFSERKAFITKARIDNGIIYLTFGDAFSGDEIIAEYRLENEILIRL